MRRQILTGVAWIAIGIAFSAPAALAQSDDSEVAHVTYLEPQQFSDFKTEFSYRERDSLYLQEELSRHFERAVKRYLPEGSRLTVSVTEVDMAGEIRPSTTLANDPRVVRPIHPARIHFEYQWFDAQNELVVSGAEELDGRDMMSLSSHISRYSRRPMAHVKALIDRWMRSLRHLAEDQ